MRHDSLFCETKENIVEGIVTFILFYRSKEIVD
jgi:hypothetical protein